MKVSETSEEDIKVGMHLISLTDPTRHDTIIFADITRKKPNV